MFVPVVGATGGGIPVAGSFVPPNGLAGFAQQTAAAQALYGGRGRSSSTRRRRKSTKKKARAAAPRKKRASGKRATKFTKGSAAAKRHMAKLRKMRKR